MKENLDALSLEIGAMDYACRMINAGVKRMAVSPPFPHGAARDRALPFCREIAQQWGVLLYIEDDFLVSDLFPLSDSAGKKHLLFFRDEGVLAVYFALKRQKDLLAASGQYTGAARLAIAQGLGALLSYPLSSIAAMVASNRDREG